jgi:hypothetical protein
VDAPNVFTKPAGVGKVADKPEMLATRRMEERSDVESLDSHE